MESLFVRFGHNVFIFSKFNTNISYLLSNIRKREKTLNLDLLKGMLCEIDHKPLNIQNYCRIDLHLVLRHL